MLRVLRTPLFVLGVLLGGAACSSATSATDTPTVAEQIASLDEWVDGINSKKADGWFSSEMSHQGPIALGENKEAHIAGYTRYVTWTLKPTTSLVLDATSSSDVRPLVVLYEANADGTAPVGAHLAVGNDVTGESDNATNRVEVGPAASSDAFVAVVLLQQDDAVGDVALRARAAD